MPKKQLLKTKKKGKLVAQGPTNENEYLEAGVDAQEAGEKWRGGDAKKSARFFVKALDIYQEGLSKFPAAFELAFNKAQLQYELTQHPRILAELPNHASVLDLLQVALESSRYAMKLQQDNADVLFNTAQVLSSVAEELDSNPQATDLQPVPFLEESLDIFQRCLSLQELQYNQRIEQKDVDMNIDDSNPEDGGVSITSAQPGLSENASLGASQGRNMVEEEEQWASVLEPVTKETLVDTITAELDVLILLCRLGSAGDGKRLAFLEEYSSQLIQKLRILLGGVKEEIPSSDSHSDQIIKEASIKMAQFQSSLSNANYYSGKIDASTYWESLNESWKHIDLSTESAGVILAAQAMLSFNSALRQNPQTQDSIYLKARWNCLSTAQNQLTKASKIPGIEHLEMIHLLRGDADLLRFQLGQGEQGYSDAIKASQVLIKNAEKFYRGAKNQAAVVGEMDVLGEAAVKEGVAKQLGGDGKGVAEAVKEVGEVIVQEALRDALDGGLVMEDQLIAMGIRHL